MLMGISRKKTFLIGLVAFSAGVLLPSSAGASLYGRGLYGACSYGSCSISVASDTTVSLPLTPDTNSVYTIAKDSVVVTTKSSLGFTLTLESDSATENSLDGSSASIDASSATPASPAVLALNTWGFRVDGLSGFGAGPTSAITNQSSSALTFAGVPLMGSATIIRDYSTAAGAGVATDVWYGVRADLTKPADTYTRTVTYTAVNL